MEKLYSPATVNRIRNRFGLKLSKKLGQNFLIDGNIVNAIVDAAKIDEKDLVIEIGPGIGVLTEAAAKKAFRVVGIEIDKKLMAILDETLKNYDNVKIINKDFMKTDLKAVIDENRLSAKRVKVIGNLPYYITTPIIMKILEGQARPKIESITIMIQKEVADRIKASPGSKIYGALSIAVQFYCEVEDVIKVPKEVFIPKPNVDSSVIKLSLRSESPVDLIDQRVFFDVVKAAFGQRRKTLQNALVGIYDFNKEDVTKALLKAGIDPERRAETLDIKEFAALANAVSQGIEDEDKG
ncbi:MAG: 16S rRNA (adenine(1518)-N(6)/adenine(1519)-N(6))-dimethyltransferase RsmA [Clostridiales bacterium]|nr:16S rRNA (adenine(1518)-N(6)/adenine(1519)-N(6))-dimethyltransferase RsmA [Clostridiales bacterium]